MALEATHMRFALDVKDRYTIKNKAEYIQGTVYPDSRYVSKINRELTHSSNFLKPDFVIDDFHAGWQVHLLCDKIQRRTFQENIHGFDKFTHVGYEENQWIHFTAAKIILDMKDVQSFGLQSTLEYLDSKHRPNGEDISIIQKNNQIMINLYQNKKVPSIDDYIAMWNDFGISNDLGEKVREKVEQLNSDEVNETIWSCYGKMIQAFDETRSKFFSS